MESKDYIIAPNATCREAYEKQTSKSFTFFFKKLNRNYKRQLKYFRQTYITREDLFVNGRISMQHANYRTTAKHYINRREVANHMAINGFRIFDKKNEKRTPDGTPDIKKDFASL